MTFNYQLRDIALTLLLRIEADAGYSHILIDREIKKKQMATKDQALLTEIVYGTLQRKITLDYYIDTYIRTKQNLELWVRMLLRMSIYQIVFLDKIPDHAVIHEAVEIAKKRAHKGLGSFVNGILRSIQRKGVPKTDSLTPIEKKIGVETSTPEWLVTRWLSMYNKEITEAMCQENLLHKPMSVRIQSMKITRSTAKEKLLDEGIKTDESKISSDGLIVLEGNVLTSTLFRKGLLTIQDQSSMLIGELIQLENDMHVLDACSAPGGKTTHLAEKMNDTGKIYAYDLQKNKIKRMRERIVEQGLTNIEANQGDARKLQEKHDTESFNRVLVDAPCSGLGVIRTKPEIKYQKTESDIHNLAGIQKDILHHVAPLLKQGGFLIYSTCTIDKEENEDVVQAFLNDHPEYEVDISFFSELPQLLQEGPGVSEWGVQIFPQTIGSDGFFLTRLHKR